MVWGLPISMMKSWGGAAAAVGVMGHLRVRGSFLRFDEDIPGTMYSSWMTGSRKRPKSLRAMHTGDETMRRRSLLVVILSFRRRSRLAPMLVPVAMVSQLLS